MVSNHVGKQGRICLILDDHSRGLEMIVSSHQELLRAIRFTVAVEYEPMQLQTKFAESTDNRVAIEVLKDIADEKRVHDGEFLRLLQELAPDEESFYVEGPEVEEKMGNLGKGRDDNYFALAMV